MRVIFGTVVLILLSAPVFGDVTYNQKLSNGEFLCTPTSGKEIYDNGDVISLDKMKEKLKVTLGVNGNTLTSAFRGLKPTVYDFTKSLLITQNQGQDARWHILFNHQPDEETPFATKSVTFLLRGWEGQKPLVGLVFTEPLTTTSDRRLYVRTLFYNCESL